MADRGRPGFSGTPGPELLALGAAVRKRVLEASQRAVVAIRALQDLVMGDACYVSWCSQAVREVEKIEGDLTQRREGRGETQRADPNTVFVIMRRPLRGATCTSSGKHRYAGNPGGWTPDPNKVTPFTSQAAAVARAHESDVVETLAQAQRRFGS
jgi:hypothetical protein